MARGRNGRAVDGQAEVIVAKQRHGSTGKVRLQFDSRITKFSDLVDEGYMPGDARLADAAQARRGRGMRAPARSGALSCYGPMSSLLSGCSILHRRARLEPERLRDIVVPAINVGRNWTLEPSQNAVW